VNAALNSGLWWLLSGPKGERAEAPKLVISILGMKTTLPFRQNDLSYNFLMILSLRYIVSVYITLKQHPPKATGIACGREQSRWKGSWLGYQVFCLLERNFNHLLLRAVPKLSQR